MSDESFVFNLGEVETPDYDLMPSGWRKFVISKYNTEKSDGTPIQVNKDGGKLPQGTGGTNWEFTVIDDENYDGRKVWETYWHHANTMGFWKSLYRAADAFTDEELESEIDILEERDRIVGCEFWGQVGIKKGSGGYDDQNTIKSFKKLSEREAPKEAEFNPLDLG